VTVTGPDGEVVRRLTGPTGAGIHRVAWDLRYPPAVPAEKEREIEEDELPPIGPLVAPGRYTARFELVTDEGTKAIGEPRSFDVEPLGNATLAAADRAAVRDFQQKTARLRRAVLGAERLVGELETRLDLLRLAVADAPGLDPAVDSRLRALVLERERIAIALSGDRFLSSRQENTPPAISERVETVVSGSWYATAAPTRTQLDAYRYAGEAFAKELTALEKLVETDLVAIEKEIEAAGAPWTPGRVPEWKYEP
jgi:hypothetical protein